MRTLVSQRVSSTCAAAGRRPDLDAADAALLGTATESATGDLGLLRQLANLPTPDPAAARELARTLRDGIDARSRLQGTDADQARHLAEIIDAALAFHQA